MSERTITDQEHINDAEAEMSEIDEDLARNADGDLYRDLWKHSQETLGRACAKANRYRSELAVLRGDAGLTLSQRGAIACGNEPFADEKVCPTCEGGGHIGSI